MKVIICPTCAAKIGIPDSFQITDSKEIHCPKCHVTVLGKDIPERPRTIVCSVCKAHLSIPESAFNTGNPNINCPLCNLTFKVPV